MLRAIVLAALVACDGGKEPVAPRAPAAEPEPSAAAPTPAPPARHSFPRIAKADRAAIAAEVAKQFPAAWKPEVEVDYAGMPKQIVLELPEAPSDLVKRAFEIIRDRASLFGVRGDLHHELDSDMIRIGAGEHWTGQIVARFAGAKLTLSGHLWPIDVVAVPIKPEAERHVAPLYGVEGEFRSRCERCKDFNFVVDKSSFTLVGGMALVCSPEGIVPRPLIAIRHDYKPGSRIPGIDKVPAYLDPNTLAPVEIPDGSAFFPGDSTRANGVTTYGSRHGFDSTGCFE